MKSILCAACLLWLFSCATTHNTTFGTANHPTLQQRQQATDTVQLLYTTFIKNRKKYINRPFSLLLKDLPAGVNEYGFSYYSDSKGDDKPKGLRLYFTSINQSNAEYHAGLSSRGAKILTVGFSTFLPEDSVRNLKLRNKYKWTKEEQAYYANYIVADIAVPGIHE